MDILLLIVGLGLILAGANFLTDGSAAVAQRFRVPEFIIGLTIVAVGTSTPELVVSVLSAAAGNSDVAIGNVVGSNLFNVFLILGVCALIRPLPLTRSNIRRDIPFGMAASLILLAVTSDRLICAGAADRIGRIDGIVMLIASLTATIGVMDWVLFNNGMESRGYSENHETLGRFDAVFGGLIPVTLVLSFVSIAFAEAFAGQEGIPTDSTALCNALVSVIPSIWIQLGFYIGIIALVCSSMIGLSVTCATSFYQSTNVKKDTKAWYHPFIVLAPQIGFLGAFFGKPVMVVVFIAAMQSLFNWISGNSWYLLGNDPRYLGKKVIQSRFFNAGILACISVLNIVFITFIMSKMGVWPA